MSLIPSDPTAAEPESGSQQTSPAENGLGELVDANVTASSWSGAFAPYWPIFEWRDDEREASQVMVEGDMSWLPPRVSPSQDETGVCPLLEQALLPEGSANPGVRLPDFSRLDNQTPPTASSSSSYRGHESLSPRSPTRRQQPSLDPLQEEESNVRNAFSNAADYSGELASTTATESVADLCDTVRYTRAVVADLSEVSESINAALMNGDFNFSESDMFRNEHQVERDDSDFFYALNDTARTSSVYALNDSVGSRALNFNQSLQLDLDRILQLGRCPTRQRLTDDEIRSLSRLRFEATELQSCSICLENYCQGQLLTALICGHTFHIDCIARWLRCNALCPNCRANVQPVSAPGVLMNTTPGSTGVVSYESSM